jgi:CDP-4-dehydro-6-deoxyglucose reductase
LKAKSTVLKIFNLPKDTDIMTSSDSGTPGFQISVQPSGRAFSTLPGETILAASIRQSVGMPYGCKDGACGSCKCKKLEGIVVHGPHQSKALSAEEAANGFVLTCCGVPHSDVVLESRQVTQAGAHPIKKMPTRVNLMEKKSADVMLLKLQLPANDNFAYHAGQYVEFILRDGARRSYSMANAPHTLAAGGGLELHIRHMPGGKFTDPVFTTMKEKEILRIEGPYGSFFLREDSDKPLVLLASGTGFAPIKAIIEHMQFKGITRPATLYWGGRRPGDLYMDDWVKARVAEMPNLRYVPVVSDALPEDGWSGRTGFVHQAVLQDIPDLSGYQVYACGAPIVVDSAHAAYTKQAGLPDEEFFADSFVTEADKAREAVAA